MLSHREAMASPFAAKTSDCRPDLTADEIEHFVECGYVRIGRAFPRRYADEGRAILWRDTGCDPDTPATWTRPVIRLGLYAQEQFAQAVNTERLHRAFDQLVGPGGWMPRTTLGTFVVRFPSSDDPGDTGWHVDGAYGTEDPDFMSWRINVLSKGRALLMLFLFSDVAENDAPTRIRVGSHLDVARALAPAGEAGLSLGELTANALAETAGRPELVATGEAGTVYLCHPFLVHAAQTHHGTWPRFLAQPPLVPSRPFELNRPDGDYSPVERAIRRGLAGS